MDNDENRLEWLLEFIRDLAGKDSRPLIWASLEAEERARDIIHNNLANVLPKRGVDYAAIIIRRYRNDEDFITIGGGRRERGRQRVARALRMLRWQMRVRRELDELLDCVTEVNDD